MALVQSVESSNCIEGVTVAADRLRPLVLGLARPKDLSEQEIAGYRTALNLVHTKAENLQITPDLMRRLHQLCQEGSGDAGQFKKRWIRGERPALNHPQAAKSECPPVASGVADAGFSRS